MAEQKKTHFYVVTIPDLQKVHRYKIGVTGKSVTQLTKQFKRFYPDYILKLYIRSQDPKGLKERVKTHFLNRCIKHKDSDEYSDCLSIKYRKLGKFILQQYENDYKFCSSVVRKFYNLIGLGSIKFSDIYSDYKIHCTTHTRRVYSTSFVQLVMEVDYDIKFK